MNAFNIICYKIARFLSSFILHRYHYRVNRVYKSKEPTLIIANHLTELDALMLMRAFPKPMRFVAGAHLLQKKIGWLLQKCFAPIFISRGCENYSSIQQILKSLKKENVVLFPEGCRSFQGETLEMPISLAKLVKRAHCQVITFRLIGGYFVAPRWAYTTRKGKMRGEMVHVYSKEEIQNIPLDQLHKKLNEDIYENAYIRQEQEQNDYKGKRLAEGIENYLEVCPNCEALDSLVSKGKEFRCTKCSLKGEYSTKGFLLHVPFSSTLAWGKWQDKKLEEFSKKEGLLFEDKAKKCIIKNNQHNDQEKVQLKAYSDKMFLNEQCIYFKEISAYSLLYYGRTLLFTYQDVYYELSDFLAYKYAKLIDIYKDKISR